VSGHVNGIDVASESGYWAGGKRRFVGWRLAGGAIDGIGQVTDN